MIQGREKQKKLKPIKQPTKPDRRVLTNQKQSTEAHIGPSIKDSLQRKIPQSMVGSSIPQQTTQEPQITTLENICTNLLEKGNVQSYIDLFYISHKCLPNVMQSKNYFGQALHIPDGAEKQTEEALQFYKEFGESLSKAEVRGESLISQKEASMNEYNSMAFNYQDQGDFVTASYFYSKVVEISRACKNKLLELVALLGLGKCYDEQNNKNEAIELLEGAFDDSAVLEDDEKRNQMSKLIGKELIEIYIKKAAETEKFNIELGLQAYESAFRVAKRANEVQSEARIAHKIGQLYYEEAKYEQSIHYQLSYLELLRRSLDEEFEKANIMEQMGEKKDNAQERINLKFKEMEAHASLAKCYLKIKDVSQAEQHLNHYHKMARETKAQNSVADSSYYLAKLFEEKGDKEKAINYYQSYFEAAKSEKPEKKDRKLVDKARVTFAIAKANRNMERYIEIIEQPESLMKVLDWKIKRVLK